MRGNKILNFLLIFGLACCGTTTPALAAGSQTTMNGVININTASTLELMQLPGIGLAKAEQIVDYRSHRQFRKTSDLMKIKGVGRKMYDRIADHLTVSEPTQLTIIRKTN